MLPHRGALTKRRTDSALVRLATPILAEETIGKAEGRLQHATETWVHRVGLLWPYPLREVLFLPLVHLITEYRLGLVTRRLSTTLQIDLIHQPVPVSPRARSFLYGQPVALVVGPMNGNLDYPPAFRRRYARFTRIIRRGRHVVSGILNYFFRGKSEAACLLAANERTAVALRHSFPKAQIEFLVENGVDLKAWSQPIVRTGESVPKFLFVGRLVHWKAVDILIDAFGSVNGPAELVIIGDGPEKTKLSEQARDLQTPQRNIRFLGYLDHAGVRQEMADAVALVLPSLRESGGAVILEAMASSLPVISIKWGGPEDYVTSETGFLIEPLDSAYVVSSIAGQMDYLARNPKVARAMGERGAQRSRIGSRGMRRLERFW
jgi:glycosyltransferase involved in cell wall biosynthesis